MEFRLGTLLTGRAHAFGARGLPAPETACMLHANSPLTNNAHRPLQAQRPGVGGRGAVNYVQKNAETEFLLPTFNIQ